MRFFSKPAIVEAPPELTTAAEKLAVATAEIETANAAVRDADAALSEYLQANPNSHAIQRNGNKIIYRLNAMDADLTLTKLERRRDDALERFHSALADHADLKKSAGGGTH